MNEMKLKEWLKQVMDLQATLTHPDDKLRALSVPPAEGDPGQRLETLLDALQHLGVKLQIPDSIEARVRQFEAVLQQRTLFARNEMLNLLLNVEQQVNNLVKAGASCQKWPLFHSADYPVSDYLFAEFRRLQGPAFLASLPVARMKPNEPFRTWLTKDEFFILNGHPAVVLGPAWEHPVRGKFPREWYFVADAIALTKSLRRDQRDDENEFKKKQDEANKKWEKQQAEHPEAKRLKMEQRIEELEKQLAAKGAVPAGSVGTP